MEIAKRVTAEWYEMGGHQLEAVFNEPIEWVAHAPSVRSGQLPMPRYALVLPSDEGERGAAAQQILSAYIEAQDQVNTAMEQYRDALSRYINTADPMWLMVPERG